MENENYTNSLINKSFLDRHSVNKFRIYAARYVVIIVILLWIYIFVLVISRIIILGFGLANFFQLLYTFFMFFIIYKVIILSEKTFFAMYKTNILSYDFNFSEKNIKIDVVGEINESYNICQYQYFTKLVERDDFFYLYVNSRNAYVIDKKGFVNGTVEDFKQLMAMSMPPNKIKFKN